MIPCLTCDYSAQGMDSAIEHCEQTGHILEIETTEGAVITISLEDE